MTYGRVDLRTNETHCVRRRKQRDDLGAPHMLLRRAAIRDNRLLYTILETPPPVIPLICRKQARTYATDGHMLFGVPRSWRSLAVERVSLEDETHWHVHKSPYKPGRLARRR